MAPLLKLQSGTGELRSRMNGNLFKFQRCQDWYDFGQVAQSLCACFLSSHNREAVRMDELLLAKHWEEFRWVWSQHQPLCWGSLKWTAQQMCWSKKEGSSFELLNLRLRRMMVPLAGEAEIFPFSFSSCVAAVFRWKEEALKPLVLSSHLENEGHVLSRWFSLLSAHEIHLGRF